MDMHGALQPLAAKMTRAMGDSVRANQTMVGAGLCMEKFEDNPIVCGTPTSLSSPARGRGPDR